MKKITSVTGMPQLGDRKTPGIARSKDNQPVRNRRPATPGAFGGKK